MTSFLSVRTQSFWTAPFSKKIELRKFSVVCFLPLNFTNIEITVEILISFIGAVLAVGGSALRRAQKLRRFDEIRKMNVRSNARRPDQRN